MLLTHPPLFILFLQAFFSFGGGGDFYPFHPPTGGGNGGDDGSGGGGGDNGTGGGGPLDGPCSDSGGGGGIGADPPETTDPCELAQPFADAVTALSKTPEFANAKTTIAAAASGNTNEHGLTFGKDANGNITTSPIVNGGTSSGSVNVGWPGGFADLHNHPDYTAPSAGDIYGLISVNNNHPGYNTRMVIALDGSVYALVITNLSSADSFAIKYPKTQIQNFPPDFPDLMADEFALVKSTLINRDHQLPLIADEMAMSLIMEKYVTGLILLKQNATGDFKRLITNSITNRDGKTIYNQINCQ